MKVFDRYFSKNPFVFIPDFPDTLSLIITIPVYDDPDVFFTLDSLVACAVQPGQVGVIVLVNYAEDCATDIKERNNSLYSELVVSLGKYKDSGIHLYFCKVCDLPVKQSGVGVARKIAMDTAARYFYDRNRPDGVIASLDADTLVEKNYCKAISDGFAANNRAGISIAYRHVWEAGINKEQLSAICKYELYLRYYRMSLAYTGHPYAYTCLGSAFAVRALDYVAEGGMNKRQAGEDFYFLQKLVATGRFTHLKTTCVYPAARISARTPFGTGQSVRQIMAESGIFNTYNFGAFRILKMFFDSVERIYYMSETELADWLETLPEGLKSFLSENDIENMIAEVKANCASLKQFRKRFFDNFNAFRVLKFLNYVHPLYWSKLDICDSATAFLRELYPGEQIPGDILPLLYVFREKDI